jgi:predicted DNA-binding protein
MRQILINMVKDEDFQQAVNLLYEMQKLQSELNKKTEAEKAARLKELIEQGIPPKKPASEGVQP